MVLSISGSDSIRSELPERNIQLQESEPETQTPDSKLRRWIRYWDSRFAVFVCLPAVGFL